MGTEKLIGKYNSIYSFWFSFAIAYKKFNSTINVFSTGLASILLIEIFQFFTNLGSFDVDDIILNMIGIVCGYLMFQIINRIAVRKR